ncbi:UNVERIFIED_CONTAM: hypothetical protein K2H54_029492 [Gekko kuhli]
MRRPRALAPAALLGPRGEPSPGPFCPRPPWPDSRPLCHGRGSRRTRQGGGERSPAAKPGCSSSSSSHRRGEADPLFHQFHPILSSVFGQGYLLILNEMLEGRFPPTVWSHKGALLAKRTLVKGIIHCALLSPALYFR